MDEVEKDKGKEVSLLDCVLVLAKRMRLILKITISVALISIVVSLILTEQFQGTAVILPPQKNDVTNMASALISQIPASVGALAGLSGGMGSPSDLFVSLLLSRTIADTIIDRFGLMELYNKDTRMETREKLGDLMKVEADKKSPIITIQVKDEDPQRATDMTNAFVQELIKLKNKFDISNAKDRMAFFEDQLKQVHAGLFDAEEALKRFQETTGAIKIDSQAGAVLEGVATLRAQTALKEIQLKVMKTYATQNNREVKQAEEELAGLLEQLKKLDAKGDISYGNSNIAIQEIPTLATEYLRKLREFKFQETLFDLLTKQYESARLDQANNISSIEVVDSAVVPEKRVFPRRSLIVVLSTIGGLFISLFAAFFAEYWEKTCKNSENQGRLAELHEYFAPIRNNRFVSKVCGIFKRKQAES